MSFSSVVAVGPYAFLKVKAGDVPTCSTFLFVWQKEILNLRNETYMQEEIINIYSNVESRYYKEHSVPYSAEDKINVCLLVLLAFAMLLYTVLFGYAVNEQNMRECLSAATLVVIFSYLGFKLAKKLDDTHCLMGDFRKRKALALQFKEASKNEIPIKQENWGGVVLECLREYEADQRQKRNHIVQATFSLSVAAFLTPLLNQITSYSDKVVSVTPQEALCLSLTRIVLIVVCPVSAFLAGQFWNMYHEGKKSDVNTISKARSFLELALATESDESVRK